MTTSSIKRFLTLVSLDLRYFAFVFFFYCTETKQQPTKQQQTKLLNCSSGYECSCCFVDFFGMNISYFILTCFMIVGKDKVYTNIFSTLSKILYLSCCTYLFLSCYVILALALVTSGLGSLSHPTLFQTRSMIHGWLCNVGNFSR